MVAFDYKHNAALFGDEEKFIGKLMGLGDKSICGSVVYEHAPDNEIKFKISKDENEYLLSILFKGKTAVQITLGDDWNRVLNNMYWFFGKAPDDDSYLKARRIARYVLFVEYPPRTFDGRDERCSFMNALFGTNL